MLPRRTGSPRTTPTLQQVAQAASVSIATASRVVTGSVPVSPDRRARVELAIAQLGYVPDERARDLRRNAQQVVGLIVPVLTSPLHAGVFRTLHRALQADGATLLTFESAGSRERERSAVEALVRGHVRAIVVATPHGLAPDMLELLRRRGIRIVFFDDRHSERGAISIGVDDHGGARTLTEHLIGLGHRRIGFLAGPLDGSTGIDRRAGHLEALERAGIASDPELIRGFGWDLAAGKTGTRELLGIADRPTAIVAAHPVLAAGALTELRARGLRVPFDVSLAAFFESDHIRFVDPPITCLTDAEERIAAAIVQALERDAPAGRIDVPLTPAFRPSTAPR